MCVALLACLREHLTLQALKLAKEGRPPPRPVTVGFIAFYRAQIQCLRRTLQAALPDGADQVPGRQPSLHEYIVASCKSGCLMVRAVVWRVMEMM